MLFDVCVRPTEEEWLDGLKRSGLRRAGKGRLLVQTIVLAVVGVTALVAFFLDGMREPMSAVIAAAATVLIPVMWLVPDARMRSMAKTAAEEGAAVHLWVFEDGLNFGEQVTAAYYAFNGVYWTMPTEKTQQTLVLRTKSDEVVVIPKRELTDDQWQTLIARIDQGVSSASP